MNDTLVSLPAPLQPEAPRILIVRVSALGDIVFAGAMLDALRTRWPRARIDWLAQSAVAGILDGDPRIDHVIRLPVDALKSPAVLLRLRRELRARGYDWVLEAQGLLKSRVLAALAGGTRIGFRSKEPGEFLIDHLLPKGGALHDISSEYRYLAQCISGISAGPPRLLLSDAARAALPAKLAELQLVPGYIALCPFTTRPQKHWLEQRWPALAAQLAAAGAPPCVLFGGPDDRQAAARIVAASTVPIINQVGQTRIAELPAWLSQAGLVIGVDTGLTHIGVAMQRPTLALFGSTCPYTQLGMPGDEGLLRVMYDALPCSPCRRSPTCDGRYDCMRQLTVERVTTAALGLLGPA